MRFCLFCHQQAKLISENIVKAYAPVRYPFLWNASFQDKTDWPGFANNGDDRSALGRNISEALGVFATFHPKPARKGAPCDHDYEADDSENLDDLEELEAALVVLKPPAWPWPIDKALAAKGRVIFERNDVGCDECHGIRLGANRGPRPTFATPVLNVGTDTLMWHRLTRQVKTGSMAGAFVPGGMPLQGADRATRLLKTTVVGILLQSPTRRTVSTIAPAVTVPTATAGPPRAFVQTATPSKTVAVNAYEARVLSGAWAAAPYLHNGSVPTLADLLTTAALRPGHFKVGRSYDITKVGLATDQVSGAFVFQATGCEAVGSGNSNCGHEYGTHLTDLEKAALLEYLKSLGHGISAIDIGAWTMSNLATKSPRSALEAKNRATAPAPAKYAAFLDERSMNTPIPGLRPAQLRLK